MKGKLTLVTGGARSGKSSFSEKMCFERGQKVAYIATAAALDEGMVDRIKKHQERRPDSWTTFEKQDKVHEIFAQEDIGGYDVFLLDCLTVLVTNIMLSDPCIDWDKVSRDRIDEIENGILDQVNKLVDRVLENGHELIVVTNEVGLGIVPENRLARVFRDIAGKANELVASRAQEVFFVVSGIPMKIKG